jgi:hypothetical protein
MLPDAERRINERCFAAVRITEFEENFGHQHPLPRTENGIEYG